MVICEERIGAMLEEQVDNVVVAALCGPEHWRGISISAFSIDGCASADEKVAERVAVAYSGPL